MMRMEKIRSHIAFLTTTLALLIMGWLVVLHPLVVWRVETATSLAETKAETDRLQQSIAALSLERDSLTLGGTEGIVWTAPQLGEATALVQARVSELAKQHGLSLRSISPLPNRDLISANVVGFRLEMEAPLDRLTEFLIDLEFNSPALAMEQSSIRRLTKLGATEGQPTLFVQIDILAPVVTSLTEQKI